MILKRLYDEPLAQASYLVGCAATGEALVIDPNRDVESYLEAAQREGLRITAVTETHIHADFVSGARELSMRTGAVLHLSDEGDAQWKYLYASEPNVRLVKHGDTIRVGNVRLEVLHTPGHTPEHISFLLVDEPASAEPMAVFTGDFVFVGDVGRPDLLERAADMKGTMEQGARVLWRSLSEFSKRPGHLMLWPGHGAGSACGKSLGSVPATTLAYEKFANWAFRVENEDAFVAEVLAGQPEPPRYFKEMKRINKAGPAPLGGFREPPRMPGDTIDRVLAAPGSLVDCRPIADVAEGFIPGTITVPLSRSFVTYAGSVLDFDRPIHLLAPDAAAAARAARMLAMIGLDDVRGWLAEDAIEAWTARHGELAPTPQFTAHQVHERRMSGDLHVLDVRGLAEWSAGHVPGATHVPLGDLPARASELPRNRPLVVHCQGGSRGTIAISVLRRLGFAHLAHLPRGYAEYARQGLPVEREPATTVSSNN
jgi:hydroxyacylglutathione hydrolase